MAGWSSRGLTMCGGIAIQTSKGACVPISWTRSADSRQTTPLGTRAETSASERCSLICRTGQAVEAARHAFEFAGLHQARQGDRRQSLLRHVTRAQQRSGACEAQHLLFVGGGGCCDGRLHAYIVLWKDC